MTNTYSMDWLDALCALWGKVAADGINQFVRSYALLNRAEFPEDVTEFPCAVTYPPTLDTPSYGMGSPTVLVWRGLTVFHLTPNVQKANLPALFPYVIRILEAAMSDVTLGGRVELFWISGETDAIQPMQDLQHGGEEPHYGLAVKWTVKEVVSGEFTIA